MVIDFGLVYKKRRLNFVLHEINDLYGNTSLKDSCSTEPEDLDLIKIQIHKLIDEMSIYDNADFLSTQAIAMCRKLFLADLGEWKSTSLSAPTMPPSPAWSSDSPSNVIWPAETTMRTLCCHPLAAQSRASLPQRHSHRLSGLFLLGHPPSSGSERPVAGDRTDRGDLIDRISPDDAVSLTSADATRALLGGAFAGFGGFLSRATRENDYLWGRLHAVDRLFDILASTVPASRATHRFSRLEEGRI